MAPPKMADKMVKEDAKKSSDKAEQDKERKRLKAMAKQAKKGGADAEMGSDSESGEAEERAPGATSSGQHQGQIPQRPEGMSHSRWLLVLGAAQMAAQKETEGGGQPAAKPEESKKEKDKQAESQTDKKEKGGKKGGNKDQQKGGAGEKGDKVAFATARLALRTEQDLRRLKASTEDAYLFKGDENICKEILEAKALWRTNLPKRDKNGRGAPHPWGPERNAVLPVVVEAVATMVSSQGGWMAEEFPKLVLKPEEVSGVVQAIANKGKQLSKIAPYVGVKQLKDDRVLVVLTKGSGTLVPPHWPRPVQGSEILRAFQCLYDDFLLEGGPPPGPLERALKQLLAKSRAATQG